jgi:hypothetical protein
MAGDTANPLATFESVPLLGNAYAQFLEAARAAAASIGRVQRFQPGYRPEAGEALVIDLQEFPSLREVVETVLSVEDLEGFHGEAEFVERFRAFATVLSHGGERGAFFRKTSPRKELARSGWVALILTDRGFNDIHDRLFLFDQQVDFIAWRGRLYVITVSALNALVPAFEVVVERIQATLRQVVPLVANAEEFSAAALSQPQMRSKLMQIASRPYIGRLSIEDLQAHVRRRNLAIAFQRGADGRERLVFDPGRETRWLILKLLDDDYLDSRMTDQRYEVNSKVSS